MAVSQPTIKAAILAKSQDIKSGVITTDDADADRLATIIANAILSADVVASATGVQSGASTAPVSGGLV